MLQGADSVLTPGSEFVSWAVVVAVWKPAEELMCDEPSLTILGTISGTLQVGATVADGETEAVRQLLLRCQGDVEFCSDSSVALSRFNKQQCDIPYRDNVRGIWTKSHLSRQEHAKKFGPSLWWAWFLNDMADSICGSRSQEMTNPTHVEEVAAIDKEAKARISFLGKRCARI